MKLCLCTISFRHHLISLAQIAQWACRHNFHGIELWGVHAKNLTERSEYDLAWLQSMHLSVPMLSDYLPLQGDKQVALEKTRDLCLLCQKWGAKKLRTFAGDKPSNEVSRVQRDAWVKRMRELCEVVDHYGVQLVVETHPNTLADTQTSTLQLLDEIDHAAMRLNLDVIHVWEGGSDPAEALKLLSPFVAHMHLKNVTSRELLHVFAPANVYAPSGTRTGMVNLFDGAFDYKRFLRSVMTNSALPWDTLDVSLEWFGPDVLGTLERDCAELLQLESEVSDRVNHSQGANARWRNAVASR